MPDNALGLSQALDAYSHDPCAECGHPLGQNWEEKYYPEFDRLYKVHSQTSNCDVS